MEIRPLTEVDPDDVLDVINHAFDRTRTLDWYHWKHLEGPWGPSRGWGIWDGDDLVGVRPFLPWKVVRNPRMALTIWRAVDGAVRPTYQRRSIFSTLVQTEMDDARGSREPRVLLSTSVPASREAYEKLGWRGFTVAHRLTMSPPGTARLRTVEGVINSLPQVGLAGRLRTAWNPPALQWRLDPRSNHDYRLVAECAHGCVVAYRTTRTRLGRAIVLLAIFGPERERAAALRAIVRREKTPLIVRCDVGRGRAIGRSLVTLWANPAAKDVLPDFADASTWAFTLADLEGTV